MAIQGDEKIIIGGYFTSYNGTERNHIARLNADGTLDNTFNTGTGANEHVSTTAIQSDGKIIIGGSFTSYNGTGKCLQPGLRFPKFVSSPFTKRGQ
ncbi:MAG: delta-60 repeat domain-containing protein [Nitrospirales bacterium]